MQGSGQSEIPSQTPALQLPDEPNEHRSTLHAVPSVVRVHACISSYPVHDSAQAPPEQAVAVHARVCVPLVAH